MPLGAFRVLWHFSFTNFILPQIARNIPNKFVPLIHRMRGVQIGSGVFIDRTVVIDEAYPQRIIIGDDVRIAAGTIIIAHVKAGLHLRQNYLPTRVSHVKLAKYSFVGANAVIMPGVTLAEGTVVVSGSVVMTNTTPYSVVSGIPAKKVKRLKKLEATNDGN